MPYFLRYIPVLLLSILPTISFAITYTVKNTNGNKLNINSLPWAVEKIKNDGENGKIEFDIPGSPPHKIILNDIIWINQMVEIDASTQTGFNGIPVVEIDANELEAAFIIIGSNAAETKISHLQIYNFKNVGIATQPGADHVSLFQNYIGFYWDSNSGTWWRNFEHGNPEKFTRANGIGIQSSYNTIDGNIISGVHNGISIGYDALSNSENWGPWNVGNILMYNRIGTTPDGKSILTNTSGADQYFPNFSDPVGTPSEWALFGNNSDGIFLGARASKTQIYNNTTSGNYSQGIELFHNTVTETNVFFNHSGTDISGTYAVPNGEGGVIISNYAHHNNIGYNTFSGNRVTGVLIGGKGSGVSGSYNHIEVNRIGVDASGKNIIPGQKIGIHLLESESLYNTIDRNIIGGNDFGIYLEDTNYNKLINNLVGTNNSGDNIGNNRDGIILDNSHDNIVIKNTSKFNGFNAPGGDEGRGIWNFNGSESNHYSENTVENNNNTTNAISEGPVFSNIALLNPPFFDPPQLKTGRNSAIKIPFTEEPQLQALTLPAGTKLNGSSIINTPTIPGTIPVLFDAASLNGTTSTLIDIEVAGTKFADFNGDGTDDLLWQDYKFQAYYIEMINNGEPVSFDWIGGDSFWKIVATPDFNGDGKADLLWRNSKTGIHTGTIMNGSTKTLDFVVGGNKDWAVVATADFNGDRKADLIWRQLSTGYYTATLMNGHEKLTDFWLGGNSDWSIILTSDLDGNGTDDLIWRQNSTGYHTGTLMSGENKTAEGWLGGNENWLIVATADFNGDGKSDLVWENSTQSIFTSSIMNGLDKQADLWLGGNPDWRLIMFPDLDGDGVSDLLWEQLSTNTVTGTLMENGIKQNEVLIKEASKDKIVSASDFDGDSDSDFLWRNSENPDLYTLTIRNNSNINRALSSSHGGYRPIVPRRNGF